MHGSVTFSAHYLGSAEVSNIDRTVESRNAMAKLKVFLLFDDRLETENY